MANNKRKKIIESSLDSLSKKEKEEIEAFLRSQARIIINCFETDEGKEKI